MSKDELPEAPPVRVPIAPPLAMTSPSQSQLAFLLNSTQTLHYRLLQKTVQKICRNDANERLKVSQAGGVEEVTGNMATAGETAHG